MAGKGKGEADERHLWPHFFRLIAACRPAVVIGEQVSGQAGYGWLDGVRSDLESEAYACEAFDIPACSVNAPHIRQRLFWCSMDNAVRGRHSHADKEIRAGRDGFVDAGWNDRAVVYAYGAGLGEHSGAVAVSAQQSGAERAGCDAHDLAVADSNGHNGAQRDAAVTGRNGPHDGLPIGSGCDLRNVADAKSISKREPDDNQRAVAWEDARASFGGSGSGHASSAWSDTEWLTGADGKTRRAKPGVRLLVDGLPGRVGLLRIGGNAIVAPLAAEVLKALIETEMNGD